MKESKKKTTPPFLRLENQTITLKDCVNNKPSTSIIKLQLSKRSKKSPNLSPDNKAKSDENAS